MEEHKASKGLKKFFEKILNIKEFVNKKSKENPNDKVLKEVYKMLDETMKEEV